MADLIFRPQALEAIAVTALKQYKNGVLINGAPQAIPIEDLIEKQFGLSIEYHHIRRDLRVLGQTVFTDSYTPIFDPDINDYTVIDVCEGTIIIDTRLTQPRFENRMRYTMSHELAHWIVDKRLFVGSSESAALIAKPPGGNDTERRADYLSAALLLPMGQVKKAFYSLPCKNSPDIIVSQMARMFKVANKTMEIRLTQHGLI